MRKYEKVVAAVQRMMHNLKKMVAAEQRRRAQEKVLAAEHRVMHSKNRW